MPDSSLLPLDASSRDYFRRAQSGERGLVFSGPLQSKLTGEWALTLSRRLEGLDGKFLGVVYAVLPAKTIGRSFAGLDLGQSGIINLRTADLAQVVRYPALAGDNRGYGNRNVSSTIRDLLRTRPERTHHVYRTIAPIDGTKRVYAYQAFSHSPFWMTVGRATADFATSWRQTAALLGALSLAAAGLLLWGANRLERQNRSLEERIRVEERLTRELALHRQNLEQLVEARTAELQAANHELDTFAYAVTHDLRAPLRAMNGFANALEEDHGAALDRQAHVFLDQIDQDYLNFRIRLFRRDIFLSKNRKVNISFWIAFHVLQKHV